MKLQIIREELEIAAIGVLYIDGERECHTLELPWRDNKSGISCIPPGTYKLAWAMSPRLKRKTLRVLGVSNRDGILIHPANKKEELKGCIACGIRSGINPEIISASRWAVEQVERKVISALASGEEVWIEIINPEEK